MKIESKIDLLLKKLENDFDVVRFLFLSLGNSNIKAHVRVIKNSKYLKSEILKRCLDFKKKSGEYPKWIKLDVITHEERIQYSQLYNILINTRRNYIDFGISFNDNYDFAFLPEEINANAFVRPSNETKGLTLSEKNINSYIRKYKKYKFKYNHETYLNREVIKFYCKGYFIEDTDVILLCEKGYNKGLRQASNLHLEIDKMLKTSVNFLKNEINPNGKYNYGYFPHFDKEINFYNNLRHSSSTYAMIEGLDYLDLDTRIAESPIDYLIDNCTLEKHSAAYIFDTTNKTNEIKLGQNAAFVFAVCEYLNHNPENERYLRAAQKVANGILNMINLNTAESIHVLTYPSLEIKEKFRIVYYDGEAALALLRLYQIDGNEKWLNAVEVLFEKFIAKDYWKYHDHWLGYCTNELVLIKPEKKYYEFGIRNVSSYLDYIEKRETTFPTFLEMLMATYKLIQRAKSDGYEELVAELIDENELERIIHTRAYYQRTGYFYPEVAMYFKNPNRVLGSFFIKHHGYRVRIDDIEHYISGYVQYQNVFYKN